MDNAFWLVDDLIWIIPLVVVLPGIGVALLVARSLRRSARMANGAVRRGRPGAYRIGRPGRGYRHSSSWSDDSATAHAAHAAHGAGGHGAGPSDHGWTGSYDSGWSSNSCSSDSGSSSSSSSDGGSSSSSSSSSDSGSSSC